MPSFQVPPFGTLYLLPFLAGAFVSFGLANYTFGRQHIPNAREFAVLEAAVAVYLGMYVLELISPDFFQKYFWDTMQWLPLFVVSGAALVYGIHGKAMLQLRVALAFALFPAVFMVFAVTNSTHGLVVRTPMVDATLPFGRLTYEIGPLYIAAWVYTAFLSLFGVMLWLRHWWGYRRDSFYGRRAVYFFSGTFVGVVVYVVLYILDIDILGQHDPTPIAFVTANSVFAFGLVQFHVREFEPFAHRRLLESLTDAVCVVDNEFRVREYNAAAQLLANPTLPELVEKPFDAAFPIWRDQLPSFRHVQHYMAEVSVVLDKQPRTFDMRVQPIYNHKGQLVGRILIARDITEKGRFEKQAMALEMEHARMQLLTNFVRDVSHEFRSPLAVIRSAAYLAEKMPAPAQRHSQLETINHQVGVINCLLDDLTTMSRLDGLTSITLRGLDVNHIVRVLCQGMQTSLNAKSITLSLDLDLAMPRIRASQDDLHTALSKLLENAVQYTPPQGKITVTTRASDATQTATIAIADTGVGIPPEHLARVFDRLYRVDDAHSKRGLGLGLPIAQRVVELHGGTIDMQSEADKGSIFTIKLPYNVASMAIVENHDAPLNDDASKILG